MHCNVFRSNWKRSILYWASQQEQLYKLFFTTVEPGQQMQLTTLGFRSPLLGSDVLSIAAVAGCALDLVAVAVVVAGCALEMKYFATTFLNSARHCISTKTKFYLQRV